LLKGHFEKFEKYLDEETIGYLLGYKKDSKTDLMLAIEAKSKDIFDELWKFLLKYFKDKDFKEFLMETDKEKLAAIHLVAIKYENDSFQNFLDFHLKLFTYEELQKIFTSENKFLHKMIFVSNLSNCKLIADLVKNIWDKNKLKLRQFLLQTNENIFKTFKNREVFREKLKVFVKLLKKTYDEKNEAEMEEFNKIISWDEDFEGRFDED
jgi:hypothetical protein